MTGPAINDSRPRLALADWEHTTRQLLEAGAVQLKGVLGDGDISELLAARNHPWQRLPENEGVVRQIASAAYDTVENAPPVIAEIATEITTEIGHWLGTQILTPLPFNEVSWSHYPAGRGHITAHRDPDAFVGLIAIFTLVGSATFRVWIGDALRHPQPVAPTNPGLSEWTAEAGDLVLIRGNCWPSPTDLCPIHEALAPAVGERVIMTLRSNTNGAGGGYQV